MRLTREDCERLGWTAALAQIDAQPTEPPAPRAKSKYRNSITTYNGVKYRSKAEALRARDLDLDVAGGLIRFWLGQPKFRLGVPENVYVADFLVIALHDAWVEDVKGVETDKFRRDKRLWLAYGPCPLRVLRRGRVVEVIVPVGLQEIPQ